MDAGIYPLFPTFNVLAAAKAAILMEILSQDSECSTGRPATSTPDERDRVYPK
jgi:hypothetical protein